jgi:hypothetical protein
MTIARRSLCAHIITSADYPQHSCCLLKSRQSRRMWYDQTAACLTYYGTRGA